MRRNERWKNNGKRTAAATATTMRFQCVSSPLSIGGGLTTLTHNLRIGARELWILIFFFVSPSNLMFFFSKHLKSFFCCKLHHLSSFCALPLSEWCRHPPPSLLLPPLATTTATHSLNRSKIIIIIAIIIDLKVEWMHYSRNFQFRSCPICRTHFASFNDWLQYSWMVAIKIERPLI